MAHRLTPELMALIAQRFKVLSEPVRLQLLDALRDGEQTVSALVAMTGLQQANVSKHLQALHAAGFVARRKAGLHVFYRIADEDVFELCHLVCGRLQEETDRQLALLATH